MKSHRSQFEDPNSVLARVANFNVGSFRLLLTILALGALSLCVYAEPAESLKSEVSTAQAAPLPAGRTVRIDGSFGYLNVQGWDQPDVQLVVTKTAFTGNGQKRRVRAAKNLERFRISLDHPSNGDLVISTTPSSHGLLARAKRGILIEYQVRVPRDAKLAIHHDSGTVLITGMTSDIEATSHYGDIVLMLPHPEVYAIDAQVAFGGVSTDFEDESHRHHLVGTRFDHSSTTAGQHRLYLRMGMGGITIKEVPPTPVAPMAVAGD